MEWTRDDSFEVNRAVDLMKGYHLEEAREIFSRFLIQHQDKKELIHNLAICCEKMEDFENAKNYYLKLISLYPNYAEGHLSLAMFFLKTGEFKKGWKHYEWRLKLPSQKFPYPSQKFWNKRDHGGRLVVVFEQSLGDVFLFLRFLPMVREGVSQLIFHGPPLLERLLTQLDFLKIDRLITKRLNEFEYDFFIPLMSLGYLCDSEKALMDKPCTFQIKSYSKPDWLNDFPSGRPLIGFYWRGKSNLEIGHRACSLDYFLKLVSAFPDVIWVSLQVDCTAEEKEKLAKFNITDIGKHDPDFLDSAFVITQSNLIISVDTSVAALAGILNRHVWVLLSYNSDWRWMSNTRTSPWFPSARIFRQEKFGEWGPVFSKISAEFSQLYTTT